MNSCFIDTHITSYNLCIYYVIYYNLYYYYDCLSTLDLIHHVYCSPYTWYTEEKEEEEYILFPIMGPKRHNHYNINKKQ